MSNESGEPNESYKCECKHCGALFRSVPGKWNWRFSEAIISPGARLCYVFVIEVFYCQELKCRKINLKFTAFCSDPPLPSNLTAFKLEHYRVSLSEESPVLEPLETETETDFYGNSFPLFDKELDEEFRYEEMSKIELSTIKTWDLWPSSIAKQFPDCIPKAILEDYQEACAIKDLSPKAAATLTRRCLQGMIRNFFGIEKKRNLKEEIDAIKEKDYVSGAVWKAIQGVREMGNIGAHMGKDINLIVDIDSGEAEKLIWLIEYLFKEWYVARDEHKKKLEEIRSMGEEKKTTRATDTEGDSREPPSLDPDE